MRFLVAAASLMLCTLAGAPAEAKVYEITLTGTSYGQDDLGIFGGGSLTGYASTLTFTLNDAWSDYSTGDDVAFGSPQPYQQLSFNPEPFEDDPRQYARLTINGITKPMSEDALYGFNYNSWLDDVVYRTTDMGGGSGMASVKLFDGVTGGPGYFWQAEASLTGISWVPGTITGAIGQTPIVITPENGFGSATFRYLQSINSDVTATTGGISNFSSFIVRELAIPAVPEPATWAMMIIGFGAVGAMLRRDRGGKRRLVAA